MTMLLHQYLEYHARARPATEFGVQGNRSISYAEANASANRFAHALIRSGLQVGDRFAYLSKNSLDMALMFFGAAKAGAVPVPLNYRLAPPEWAYIIKDAGARLLFAQGAYAAALESVRTTLDVAGQCILLDTTYGSWLTLDGWLADAPATNPDRGIAPGDALYQMYTSGTTGRPKGAVLTHASVIANAHQSLAALGSLCRPGERILLVMPLYHAGGSSTVVGSVISAGAMVFHEDFVPRRFLDSLANEAIVAVNVVPAMIQACLAEAASEPPRRFPQLRCLIYGASPITETTLRQGMAMFGCEFFQGFGQTESSAVLTFLTPEDHRRALQGQPDLLQSAGRPVIGTELRIKHPDGRFLPPGQLGEIVARGAQVMRGYWNLPEQTAKTLAGGWLHTGDAGVLDEDGYLYIRDRVKDMIVSGGENVYPREVEEVLSEYPGVAEAAVIGVPDQRYGEAVMAVIAAQPGVQLVPQDIIDFCRPRLGGYKIPRRFAFVDALPRTATGKVLKRELRDPYWSGGECRGS